MESLDVPLNLPLTATNRSSSIAVWVKSAARDLWVKAKEEAEKILKEHEVLPLPKDAKDKIMNIVKGKKEGD
jgi:trimethylamine:corrinoid methyltransferase-like protein